MCSAFLYRHNDYKVALIDIMSGDELKQKRKSKGMSQSEFAQWLGCTKDHISRMERGASPISRAVELACQDNQVVDFDLEIMNKVHEHAVKTKQTFEQSFWDLVKKGLSD